MTTHDSTSKLRVLIVGGGIAALETALALAEIAPELCETTVLAPNAEFVDRPMTVREPFAYPQARRFALEDLVRGSGAELVADELAWVDPQKRVLHTTGNLEIGYDALVLALGGLITPRYKHAITIDDRKLDETLHGLIQDVEEGYVQSIAFVAPGRMAWPLPLYELALMTAARAYDMNVELATTIVTPEDAPLAIFGSTASAAVGKLLEQAKIDVITSAYAEIPHNGEIVINPADRNLKVDRIVALPELYGPCVRGVPLSEHGFLHVDAFGRLRHAEGIYAAGDATEFAIKHGGIASQQADVVAQSIAALAGAPVTPEPFPSRDPRHAAHGWITALSDGSHHRGSRLQLRGLRYPHLVAPEQGRIEVPCPLPRGADGGNPMSAQRLKGRRCGVCARSADPHDRCL